MAGAPLGADEWLASESARPALVIVGVPAALASGGHAQTWRTPAAVRAALRRFPACDHETGIDLSALAVRDLGDWDVAGLGGDEASSVVEGMARRLADGPVTCFVGGDEMVLAPLVGGLAGGEPGEVGLLAVGSHPGAPSRPGSAIGEALRTGVSPERVIQVGIGAVADADVAGGVEIVTMDTIDEVGAAWVVTSALNDLARTCRWVFAAIDLGVLDMAFAPWCRSARPGGMTPRQLGAAARAAGAHPVVRAADLVGIDPARDPAGLTVMNAAYVLLAFAGGLAMRKAV